ncbi:Nac domain-containing protein [Thalictrum thalictroides]|uniref:Nac domain-containing protein n=1 Tax=Thalictrum thalictroides TaxID=46969 RepID=A0A7J6WUK8_THATH|nr:Nac domain-containing protein [Thalictrum thalictroides]
MCELPPGFRFHPTDEELIVYYLKNQMVSRTCPISIISEVDIYKFDPWELPEKADFGENEWYFFTPRDRKYPNGVRPNRATTSGYWKATGTDKAIHSGSKYVGVRKTLVFYEGRPPKGVKSDWIMNEYRLGDSGRQLPNKQNGSMRLDDWVLCRIYKKGHSGRADETTSRDSCTEGTITSSSDVNDQESLTLPRIFSFGHLLDADQYLSFSHLLSEMN